MDIDAVIEELARDARSMRFKRLKAICDHFFGQPRIRASHHIYSTSVAEAPAAGFGNRPRQKWSLKMAKKKINIPFRADEYSYRVQYSPDDQAFIGLVDEFPGLSAFSGTLEGAVKEIKAVVSEGLRLLAERNEQIPEPLSRREYSGKFIVRLDPALHRQLAIEATRKGVSLNEHVREKLASV